MRYTRAVFIISLAFLMAIHPVLAGIEIKHLDVSYGVDKVTVKMEYALDGIEKLYMVLIGGDSIKDKILEIFSGEDVRIESINETQAVIEINNCVEFNGVRYVFHGIEIPGTVDTITLRFPSGLVISYSEAEGIPSATYRIP